MGNHHQHHHHPLDANLPLNDYRYLMKKTHLTPDVIEGWYRDFLHVCPSGELMKNQFVKFYQQLENSSTKHVETIAENVFQAFDLNGNHRIDFKEFLVSYALTSIGEPLDKLQYAFSFHDKNHSETIEFDEMVEVLGKLHIITGNEMKNDSMQSLASEIFQTLDLDQNHSLSREEFINGCLKNESIRNVLSTFETDYPPKSE